MNIKIKILVLILGLILGSLNQVQSSSVIDANTMPGIDIGAQVNAAMVALPNGGTIQIDTGTYNFSTHIQCPVAANATYHIQGASRMGYGRPDAPSGALVTQAGGTVLNWTGNGTAIDQTITDSNYQWQSLKGCEFSDFSLVSANDQQGTGIAFGGVTDLVIRNVKIGKFYTGIFIQNMPGGTTERYHVKDVQLEDNSIGIYYYASSGGSNSFGFGEIDIDYILHSNPTGRTVLFLNGAIPQSIYNSLITIRGNMWASPTAGTQSYLVLIGGLGTMSDNKITLMSECDGPGHCGSWQNWGTVSGNNIISYLENYSGTWSIWGHGVN